MEERERGKAEHRKITCRRARRYPGCNRRLSWNRPRSTERCCTGGPGGETPSSCWRGFAWWCTTWNRGSRKRAGCLTVRWAGSRLEVETEGRGGVPWGSCDIPPHQRSCRLTFSCCTLSRKAPFACTWVGNGKRWYVLVGVLYEFLLTLCLCVTVLIWILCLNGRRELFLLHKCASSFKLDCPFVRCASRDCFVYKKLFCKDVDPRCFAGRCIIPPFVIEAVRHKRVTFCRFRAVVTKNTMFR